MHVSKTRHIYSRLAETSKMPITKLVILDLDETLVHATTEPPSSNWDFEVPPYKVFKRPFLDEFLDNLKEHYQVAVWSSAGDEYVDQIVAQIFPENYPLKFVWGRTRCTRMIDYESVDQYGYSNFDHLHYAKVLKKVKKAGFALIEDILIVDDTPRKAKVNYGNAIYPKPFSGEPEDNELELLLKYLVNIKNTENFRKLEKRYWRDEVGGQSFSKHA